MGGPLLDAPHQDPFVTEQARAIMPEVVKADHLPWKEILFLGNRGMSLLSISGYPDGSKGINL